MTVTLSPELEMMLERRLHDGTGDSVQAVLRNALGLLDEFEGLTPLSREEVDARLEQSSAQADRGEVWTAEEAKQEVMRRRAEARQ